MGNWKLAAIILILVAIFLFFGGFELLGNLADVFNAIHIFGLI